MKILIYSLLPAAAAAAAVTATQPATPALRVQVDSRIELLSLVFRLAGNPEYSQGRVKSYTDEVEQHFAIFRGHPAVEAAKRLCHRRGISYDAVMSMAAHITDTVNLNEKVPFDPLPGDLDERWTTLDARNFLVKLRIFVKDSDFNEFFNSHRPLYEKTTARFRELLEKEAHLEWFNAFFGVRPGADFIAVPALLNGGSCYAARCLAGPREQVYCILGVWLTDGEGLPRFDKTVLPTVIHEFTHSYANPLVDAHLKELRSAGELLFPRVRNRMERMAYGSWVTMMRESLVRACVIRYQRKYEGLLAVGAANLAEIRRGFLWMPNLVEALSEYEEHRQVQNLEEFMPRVVSVFDRYAFQIDQWQQATRPEDRH